MKDLTARAFGAWLVGFGVATAQIAWESDWRRVRAATSGAAVLGVLQLVALLRCLDDPDSSGPQTWLYVAIMAGFVGLSLWGWKETKGLEGSTAAR